MCDVCCRPLAQLLNLWSAYPDVPKFAWYVGCLSRFPYRDCRM